jgi:molybdate transport system substrate-binding protein
MPHNAHPATRVSLIALAMFAGSIATASAKDLVLYGAGSLKGSMTEIAAQFDQRFGTTTKVTFGPSGMMRERIEKGEPVDIFTSADIGNPQKLIDGKHAGTVVLFARNRLCAMAKPSVGLTTENLLDKALDPGVKLGTSTPKADPGGDYTWELFHKADSVRPGSFAALDAKALKLVGGPQAVAIPAGHNAQAYLIGSGQADMFISYCSGANDVRKEMADVTVAELPKALAVSAGYGLTVLDGADPQAYRLALFILSPDGQQILARNGFSAPTEP